MLGRLLGERRRFVGVIVEQDLEDRNLVVSIF